MCTNYQNIVCWPNQCHYTCTWHSLRYIFGIKTEQMTSRVKNFRRFYSTRPVIAYPILGNPGVTHSFNEMGHAWVTEDGHIHICYQSNIQRKN